jgi:acetolactate synthase-1/2/3 large subunit
MADKPAITLLHLGPGLGNGLANLHNAKKAGSPIINMVGDHATYHLHFDAPLTSDAAGVARPMSDWVRTSKSNRDLAQAGAEAYSVAVGGYPGKIATVIVPADHAWTEGSAPVTVPAIPAAPRAPHAAIAAAVDALKAEGGPKCLFLGGRALREDALHQAGRIAAATGCRLVAETFAARHQRGAGRVAVEKLPYFGEQAEAFLKDFGTIVFCGAEPPVSFFAYPGKPSWLSPPDASLVRLASMREDALDALTALADALDHMIPMTWPEKMHDMAALIQAADYLRACALVLLDWAWLRIDAAVDAHTPHAATRWQAPAQALRHWVLPEFQMRTYIIVQQCAAVAA